MNYIYLFKMNKKEFLKRELIKVKVYDINF